MMKKKIRKYIRGYGWLIGILLLAAVIRLWQLGSIPSGVLGDEAGIGYIAYSIGKIGISPYGDRNIFAIRETWGGSRPPLYIYSVIPSVMVLGLTPFAIRLPSAIFGIASVFIFYLLLRQLFHRGPIPKIGALLFALNPWAIQISRQALLESITLFLIIAGIYAFVRAKINVSWYLLSAICFVASLFSYDAPKIFLPPFILTLIFLYRKKLVKAKKAGALFLFLVVIGYILMLKLTFFGLQTKDFNAVSIFRWQEITRQVNAEREFTMAPLWLSSVFHNKVTVMIKNLITSYTSIFSLNWLFINGAGNLQHSVARHGEYYIFGLPLFFLGFSMIASGRVPQGLLFIFWLLLGALPGGFTTNNNPLRAVLMLPAPIALSAIGLDAVIRWLGFLRKRLRVILIGLGLAIMVIYVSSYLFTYFFDYPVYASEWWSKQQDDAIRFAVSQENHYPQIFINGNWRIMYAFFAKTDPKLFLASSLRHDTYRDIPVTKLGTVVFGNFEDAMLNLSTPSAFFPKGSLLIVNDNNFPDAKPLKIFSDPGGVRVIYKAIESE